MNIVKAWKDPEYRASLTPTQLSTLPANPAGIVELTESELATVDGGSITITTTTITVTQVAGCFSINNTVCNGSCAVDTTGCCG